MRTHQTKRAIIPIDPQSQSNPDKFDLIQQSTPHTYYCCMSQRDADNFNPDSLNIFSANSKGFGDIDFSSFFKKKSTAMDQVSEKKNEDYNQISDFKYQFSEFKYQKGKENEEYSPNIPQYSQSNQNSIPNSQQSNYQCEKKPIFGLFSSKKKQNDVNNMANSIELTRKNTFKQEQPQNDYIFNGNRIEQKIKIQKREMSIEQEFQEIPDRKYNDKKVVDYNQQNKQMRIDQSDYKYYKDNEEEEQEEEECNQGDSHYMIKNNIRIHISANSQRLGLNKTENNMHMFDTPNTGVNKRKGKLNTKIIDSSSGRVYNFNENSNSSNANSRLNREVDSTNIIQNPSSKRRLTRRSANTLHESFRKQIFNNNANNNMAQNRRRRDSSNNKMKSETEEVSLQKRSNNESKKLKKLVKNKRRSEGNYQKNGEQSQLSEMMKNCAICLSLPEDSIFGKVQCSHEFCLDCIVQWSNVTNQCPMCRADFYSIIKKNYNDFDDNEVIQVEQKKQRIHDDDEFYWEEASFLDDSGIDEICYICETDQDEEKLIVCDHCGFRICHTYCDDSLQDDSIPSDDWFCHECRIRSELFQ